MKFEDLTMNTESVVVDLACGEIKIKKHLLIEEITTIVEKMLEAENSVEREIAKAILLVHFCTDIEVKKEDGNIVLDADSYNVYNTNGILTAIDNTVDEVDLWKIEDCVKEEEGVNKIATNFCNEIKNSVEKGLDTKVLEKAIEEIKKVQK